MLKKANVHVEEDLSKRTRENRAELRKFMRQVYYIMFAKRPFMSQGFQNVCLKQNKNSHYIIIGKTFIYCIDIGIMIKHLSFQCVS